MFLRPRHVSAAVVSSTTAVDDGKPALTSIEEEVDGLLYVQPAAAETKRRQRSILRQIRFRRRNLNLKLHLSGITRSRRKAMLTICGGWCLLSACTVLLFALLRTKAMASVVSAGASFDDGGQMFTVLVNTFERPRQLEEALRHYAKCEGCVFRSISCMSSCRSYYIHMVCRATRMRAVTADKFQRLAILEVQAVARRVLPTPTSTIMLYL